MAQAQRIDFHVHSFFSDGALLPSEILRRAAVECPEVDLLAHPGFISPQEAALAVEQDIILELTSRRGHCLTNGHVAHVARAAGAKLVVNTDTHDPGDLITQEMARLVAAGAGLTEDEVQAATITHPQALLARLLARRHRRA
jgi:putative hydrolase